jgi:FkbM family methyltransferase
VQIAPANVLERTIKKAFNKFGLEIRKKELWAAYGWMSFEGIKTILDIGSNVGQAASNFHEILPDAKIYSFEPLASCFEELKRNMNDLKNFQCFNCALGNENSKRTIYHNEYSDSSSLLLMEQLHKDAFPFTKNAKEEMVDVRRLDDVADSLQLLDNIFIKVDVQGFEDRVIQGGEKTIKRAKFLVVETSFEPLYRGQLLFDGIYSMLKSLGFVFKGCEEFALRNPKDGHLLVCDSVFVREDNIES